VWFVVVISLSYVLDHLHVFKAIFTKQTQASQGALRGLLSAVLKKTVTVIKLKANELRIDDLRDRQIRYDINYKFDTR
jgi:hypothetical protein